MKIKKLKITPISILSEKENLKIKGGHNWLNSPSRSENAKPIKAS